MDTFAELISAVQSDLNVGSESSLFPLATVKLAINRAYINKVAALFRWPETKDAKTTSTNSGIDYYDYPQKFRTNSMYKLVIDGVRYGLEPDGSPMEFTDFLNWKEDGISSTDKRWADYQRKIFISPTPTSNGTNNMDVYGYKVPDKLTSDSDVTVFSYSTPECNEAIVLEAVAVLKSKGENEKSSQFRSVEAKQMLISAWDRIKKESAKSEKIEPFFEVPDFFGGTSSKDMRGRFDI